MRLSDYSCKYFRSSNALNSFLSDVRKHPVPTVEEEEALIERYKNGDESAKDDLIVGNLRFVYSLAKIYARDENEVTDYVNEGVIGLTRALEEFDATKGYKFITLGVWYIRRQMNYYMLTKRDIVSHSAQVGNITKKSDRYRQKYFAENGRMPSNEEVIEMLKENYNIKVTKQDDLFESGISSIEEDVAEDYTVENTNEYNEATASYNDYEDSIDMEYFAEIVAEYLNVLPEKMAKIVKMKFGIGQERAYSSEEIGIRMGILPERIDKICESAILRMREVNVAKKVV